MARLGIEVCSALSALTPHPTHSVPLTLRPCKSTTGVDARDWCKRMARTLGAVPQYFPAEAVPAGAQMPALSAWWRRLVRVARHDDHPWNASLLIESLVQEGRACWSHAQSGARNRSAAARSRPDA